MSSLSLRFTSFGLYALLFIAVSIGGTKSVHADCVIDMTNIHNFQSGVYTASGNRFAQPFTTCDSTPITSVSLYTDSVTGTPTDDYFIEIRDDLIGLPNSIIGTSDVVDSASLNLGGYTTFTFSTPVVISPTTQYWFTPMRSNTSATSDYLNVGEDSTGATPNAYSTNSGIVWTADQLYPMSASVYESNPPPPPPPPPPSAGLSGLIDMATSSYQSTTGISMTDVTTWTSDNILKLFLGSGIATLYELRFWIVALMMFAAIVYFSFRALGFFKY